MIKKEEKPKKRKQKMRRRTKFTIFSVFNLVWYTVTVLVLSALGRQVPSELTISWFSAWTVELALLYGIKTKAEPKTPYPSYNSGISTANIPTNDFNELQNPEELDSDIGVG